MDGDYAELLRQEKRKKFPRGKEAFDIEMKDHLRCGRTSKIKKILDRGVSPDEKFEIGGRLLTFAVSCGSISSVKLLLDRGAKIDAVEGDYEAPLRDAMLRGNLTMCNLLMARGTNMHLKTSNKSSYMHTAAFFGNIDVMSVCIAQGISVDILDGCGRTPLHYAVLNNNSRVIVAFLLTHGANSEIKDNSERTPADRARARGYDELAEFIENFVSVPLPDVKVAE